MTEQTVSEKYPHYDKMTDHDPLIGEVNIQREDGRILTDPTALTAAITHEVILPKTKYESVDKVIDRHKRAQEFVDYKKKHGTWPSVEKTMSPSQKREYHYTRQIAIQIENVVNHIKPSVQKPVRVFEFKSGIPVHERILHRFLVLWRKRMRALKQSDSGRYRWSTEKLINQHARVNNLETHISYRHKDENSHKDSEKIMESLKNVSGRIIKATEPADTPVDVSHKMTFFGPR